MRDVHGFDRAHVWLLLLTRAAPTLRRLSAVLLLSGATGALPSCGPILGVGDYAVGSAGSPGKDGEAETAGSDVRGHDDGDAATDISIVSVADANGDAAESGVASIADGNAQPIVDSEKDGSEPVSDGAPPDAGATVCGRGLSRGSPGLDRVVRACVAAVSCDPFIFETTLGYCITNNYLSSNGTYACLSTIQDCNGFYQCTGRRIATPVDCPSAAASTRCDVAGNLAIDCNAGSVTNCTRLGGTCGTYADAGGATHAECAVVPSCSETDGVSHCSPNGRLYRCRDGVGFGNDCTLKNATCNAFSTGTTCYFNGADCPSPGITCNAGILTQCASPANRQFNYDCTAMGFSCQVNSDVTACMAPGCTSFAACPAVESCGPDGKTLTVCAGGEPLAIDCAKEGFAGCSTFKDATGNVYGYCL